MTSLKPQIRARIRPKTYESLLVLSRVSGQSQSKITDTALRKFLRAQETEAQDNALLRRLDHTTRQLYRLDRDVKLLTDAFTLYLQYFFTVIPEIPGSQSEVRAAQGVKHLHDFMDQFRGFVESGGASIKNAVEDLLVTENAFYSEEDLRQLKESEGKS